VKGLIECPGHVVFDWDGTLAEIQSDRRYHLFPGVLELIQKLSDLGCLIYLWTARDRSSMVRILDELMVKNFFTEIATPTDCSPKPSSDGLVMMLDHVDKNKVIVIGDTHADMIGAKNFGAWAIGPGWNQNINREVLMEFKADFIVETPEQCFLKIKELLRI
jgi:phosphoglycolate phosphatase